MDYAKQINVRLMLVTFVILLSASIGLSYFVANLFQRQLAPEIERKAFLIGDTLRTELARAIGLGIPFQKLREVDRIFSEMQSYHSEIEYIAVTDAGGRVLHRSGDVPGVRTSNAPGLWPAGSGLPCASTRRTLAEPQGASLIVIRSVPIFLPAIVTTAPSWCVVLRI